MDDFLGNFSKVFESHHNASEGLTDHYVRGLFQSYKKNIEKITEKIPNSNYENLQHFISDSPWSARALMDSVALKSSKLYKRCSQENKLVVGLYIDETSFKKKGEHSVGVAKQYLGCIGKTDNGQVAVITALGSGTHCNPIDCHIFLPRAWTENSERCDKAKVPESERNFKTKIDLALESINHQISLGVDFDFIAFDALYGSSIPFLRSLNDLNRLFVGRIRCNMKMFIDEPDFILPPYSGRGPKPKIPKTTSKQFSSKVLCQLANECQWEKIEVRDSTKGKIKVEAFLQKVWLKDSEKGKIIPLKLLIIREKDKNGEFIYTYSLTNADDSYSLMKIVKMDRQRYWIERSFQDGKTEIGMAQYQVRSYIGFYHHMSLCMLAALFMADVRMDLKDKLPLISCRDIVEILQFILQERVKTIDDLFQVILERHIRRARSIENMYKRQNE